MLPKQCSKLVHFGLDFGSKNVGKKKCFNGRFKKLFQNGIEEFFTDFWNVDSDLEIYLSKLK